MEAQKRQQELILRRKNEEVRHTLVHLSRESMDSVMRFVCFLNM